MSSRTIRAFALALSLCACQPSSAPGRTGACVLPDRDNDSIPDLVEGDLEANDGDADGLPDADDTDSDGDGWSDAEEAGDEDCLTVPGDSDGDARPDYLDPDSNDDRIADRETRGDSDGDGVADRIDPDADDDRVPNWNEAPGDLDGDGLSGALDPDSDGDGIADGHDGLDDLDHDGARNSLDLDADGDGTEDAVEAGDGELATPPRHCDEEADFDGFPDFLDVDSDNDGASDGEERDAGTDACSNDSDSDGFGDAVEIARRRVECRTGGEEACSCAASASCGIPTDSFYVVLPYLGEPEHRTLEFATAIQAIDVAFLIDTSGSHTGLSDALRDTIARPEDGIVARVQAIVPDARFSVSGYEDFPFTPFGVYEDPIREILPNRPYYVAQSNTADAVALQTALAALTYRPYGDGPESATEALYQLLTGRGGAWLWNTSVLAPSDPRRLLVMPPQTSCLEGAWGAVCFRPGAIPVVVHFAESCSHNGPPGDELTIAPPGWDSLSPCSSYDNATTPTIAPEPHVFAEVVERMREVGARYVGLNTRAEYSCVSDFTTTSQMPCRFMREMARQTGSVDVRGRALMYDVPHQWDDAPFPTRLIGDHVVDAVQRVASGVPMQVDTRTRDDFSDPDGVDATRFIGPRVPACIASADRSCWAAPIGIEHDAAVASFDDSTFFGVVPGTRLSFQVRFQNDFLPGGLTTRVFVAFIDVRSTAGTALEGQVLDTREVFVVIPASRAHLPF